MNEAVVFLVNGHRSALLRVEQDLFSGFELVSVRRWDTKTERGLTRRGHRRMAKLFGNHLDAVLACQKQVTRLVRQGWRLGEKTSAPELVGAGSLSGCPIDYKAEIANAWKLMGNKNTDLNLLLENVALLLFNCPESLVEQVQVTLSQIQRRISFNHLHPIKEVV